MNDLDADVLLRAYAYGVFPMAESADANDLFWVDPEMRGVLPLDTFHMPRRLQRTVRAAPYRVTIDQCFRDVMMACASPREDGSGTWINETIIELYCELHQQDHAHSIEVWEGDKLVGGLYGVSLGAVFFGESMFSRARDASKIALIYLVARLKRRGYKLLDTQFVTSHLSQFGATEIERDVYKLQLAHAIVETGRFTQLPVDADPAEILQSITQAS